VNEQVLSPAIKIDGLTGISEISGKNGSLQAWVEGRDIIAPANARIYNVNGVACNGKDLEKGLYIVTDGISNIKLLVK